MLWKNDKNGQMEGRYACNIRQDTVGLEDTVSLPIS